MNQKENGTILLDMDEVIAEMAIHWLHIYNEKYDDNLTVADLLEWDTSKVVKPECGMKIYDLLKHPGLFRYLKPNPYAVQMVKNFHKKGYETLIVSDAPRGHAHCEYQENLVPSNPADDKRAWLEEHFPMISQRNVIFASKKQYVRGDLLIDDKPDTFLTFQKLNLHCILMDQPYNRMIRTKYRAKTLLEAEEMAYDILEKKKPQQR